MRITPSSPGEIERLLTRTDQEFEGFAHRRFDTDFRTPPEFIDRMVLEEYERSDALILLLDSAPAGAAPTHDIRPVVTDEDWAAYYALNMLTGWSTANAPSAQTWTSLSRWWPPATSSSHRRASGA